MNRQWTGFGLAGTLVLITGCASGGPAAQGPALLSLQQSFTGVWAIDPDASDPVDGTEMGNLARGGFAPDGPGGRPRELPAGSGGSEGARAPIGRPGMGRLDPAAMQTTLDLAALRPNRLRVTLDDTHLRVVYLDSWILPVTGESVLQEIDGHEITGKVSWDGDIPELEREIKLGGKIIDRFEVITPGRLRITRRIDMGLGARRDRRSFRMVFGLER